MMAFGTSSCSRVRTCPACNDGITFYRSLGKYARDVPDLRFVIAAVGNVETVRNWADTHGIRYDVLVDLRNAVSFGFSLTPTLLLMDDDGVVTDVLLRRLSAEEESVLWERLRRPDSVSPFSNARYTTEIDDTEFQDLIVKDRGPPCRRRCPQSLRLSGRSNRDRRDEHSDERARDSWAGGVGRAAGTRAGRGGLHGDTLDRVSLGGKHPGKQGRRERVVAYAVVEGRYRCAEGRLIRNASSVTGSDRCYGMFDLPFVVSGGGRPFPACWWRWRSGSGRTAPR